MLLTSRWRNLASSSSRVRQRLLWRPSSPPQRPQTHPRRSLAPLRCARPPLLTARRWAPPRPPWAPAPPPPQRPLATGAEDPISRGGGCPLSLPSSPSSDDEFSGVAGGRESILLAQPVLLIPLFPALPPPDFLLLLARRPLLLPSLHGAGDRSGSGRGRVRPRGVHGHPLLMAPIKITPICRGDEGPIR
jgi:hypothetical protein